MESIENLVRRLAEQVEPAFAAVVFELAERWPKRQLLGNSFTISDRVRTEAKIDLVEEMASFVRRDLYAKAAEEQVAILACDGPIFEPSPLFPATDLRFQAMTLPLISEIPNGSITIADLIAKVRESNND